ncbi:ABC transporter permease [Metabacillus sp. RGM 3146]|uniref:ABC transporter permease n=1 Tax=Metabacillus sp. RGM 3146 TaxID=3401092 RepID=UPI003B9BD09F
MKKIWTICSFEILRLLKKPQSYILMFALPLLLTMIFGSLLGGGGSASPTLAVVDQDQSHLSKSYYDLLHKEDQLYTLQKSTEKEAQAMLDQKKVSGIIIVPKEFEQSLLEGRAPVIKFQHTPDFTSVAAVNQFLSGKLSKISIEAKAAEAWSQYSGEDWQTMYNKISSEVKGGNGTIKKELAADPSLKRMSSTSSSAAGFTIMFVMIMMMSVTGTILEARKNGVWYRMLSAPATKFEISAGYLLSFFLIGWVQFGILMLATHFMFDVQWGNFLGTFILVSALLLAVVGLGLVIAGSVKTAEQQSAMGNLIVVSTCMISGVYWPIDIEPEFMQKIANFLPQTWAMKGFTELVAKGGTLMDITGYIGILALFAAGFLVIGMSRIKYE